MIRWAKNRVRVRRDDGAILVFAMIIVTVVALVVGMILTRGNTSLRATVALRSVAGSSYAADAAANVAINDLRTGYGFTSANAELGFNNNPDDGLGCFGNSVGSGGTDSLSLPGSYPATGSVGPSSAYIECTGEAGTGQQGSPVLINGSNTPGQAILTLGAKSSNGLTFGASAAETDIIHGKVTSDTGLISKGTLNVTGNGVTVDAAGGCTGTVQINGTAVSKCGTASKSDPNYPAPTTPPVVAPTPTCPTAAGGPEIFYPGLYTVTPDQVPVVAEVQTITITSSPTGGTFTPALAGYGSVTAQTYNVTPANLQTALRNAWSIAVTVTGTAGSNYVVTFPVPLGNVPQMTTTNTFTGTGNPKANVATTTDGSSTCPNGVGWMYFTPTSNTATGVYYFNWPGVWTITGTVVAGMLSTANDGTTKGGTSITPAGGANAPTNPGACVNPILDQGAVGVELVFGGTSRVDMQNTSLKEFCATYSATAIPTVVYGLKSAVGSGPNQVPAQSGCIVNSPAGSLCPMINASSGKQAQFYFEGFVYAPWAYVNLTANNVSQPFFNFGLVTDTLFVGANKSTKCVQCAFINLPDKSPGYGYNNTTVDLTVRICLGSATVTAACRTSTPALTSRVQLWDPTGVPVPNSRQISVLSWSRSN